MSCIGAHDPHLTRLADAIAQRVGQQRFHVWFNNSTRLELKQDGLDICVPNDFISEWIGAHYTRSIQEAAHEVLGCSLPVRFSVVPQLFDSKTSQTDSRTGATLTSGPARSGADQTPRGGRQGVNGAGRLSGVPSGGNLASRSDEQVLVSGSVPALGRSLMRPPVMRELPVSARSGESNGHSGGRPRLRHDMESFVVGASNQLAYNAAAYVSEFPGAQYNPLFIHGACGLGKTHLLQGLCRRFTEIHPTRKWVYLTGEEFTNEFLTALRANKLDAFRRKMRDLDLLVIDDVHFLGGKKATQEEFLHTFNAIEATGRQVVMASDNHPKMIEEFGESLINRFVSGMVVRIDPPNFATRCDILRAMATRHRAALPEEVVCWIARRVTQNVRELEGAITRIMANVAVSGGTATMELAQQALGDLDRHLVQPVRPDAIIQSICDYFALELRDLMSGRRQKTISLARSVAMYLVRKTAKLSFPEIGQRMGKRNHSTVISACRRIERAVARNERLSWTSAVGEREEEACELIQRLEEHARAQH